MILNFAIFAIITFYYNHYFVGNCYEWSFLAWSAQCVFSGDVYIINLKIKQEHAPSKITFTFKIRSKINLTFAKVVWTKIYSYTYRIHRTNLPLILHKLNPSLPSCIANTLITGRLWLKKVSPCYDIFGLVELWTSSYDYDSSRETQ